MSKDRAEDARGRAVKGAGGTSVPVVLMGVLVGLTVVGGLTVVEISRWRRTSPPGDVTASSCSEERTEERSQERSDRSELEALRVRVALLSARLASADGCAVTATAAGPARSGDAPPSADEDAPPPIAPDAPSAPPVPETTSALSSPWATEVYLRELARSATPDLALSEVTCSEELCRLSFGGGGSPEDDALKLQTFVGRATERLPKTLIQPGANGAASVVLVARPGHELPIELPDLPKQTLASQLD